LLLEQQGSTGDGDVVIGGEQGDQAKHQAADGLGEPQSVKTQPGASRWRQVWRKRRVGAVAGGRVAGRVGGRHGGGVAAEG